MVVTKGHEIFIVFQIHSYANSFILAETWKRNFSFIYCAELIDYHSRNAGKSKVDMAVSCEHFY